MYAQLAFALDRVKAEAASHPEWKDTQPFKAVLEGDMKTLAAAGEKGLMELIMATHAGMTTDEFQTIVTDWIATARDPRFKKPYTELVYQPMLELLAYLRANGFKTFIVSGGGIEFMRPWTEKVYGVPPEQVVGSSIKTQFEMKDGAPTLMRLPQVNFIDDKAGKPVGINEHIGRRPIAAFGNSDGDLEMLQWTTLGDKPRFRPDRPSHRCRARICLRPEYGIRPPRHGARCRGREPVDRRRHEGRLEDRSFPESDGTIREVARRRPGPSRSNSEDNVMKIIRIHRLYSCCRGFGAGNDWSSRPGFCQEAKCTPAKNHRDRHADRPGAITRSHQFGRCQA